jgi:hypothetical protein
MISLTIFCTPACCIAAAPIHRCIAATRRVILYLVCILVGPLRIFRNHDYPPPIEDMLVSLNIATLISNIIIEVGLLSDD